MIALLSNVTLDSLRMRVGKKLNEDVFTSPGFDTWQTEFLNPTSRLWQSDIKVLFVVLHGPAFFPDGIDSRFAEVFSVPLGLIAQAQTEHKDKIFVVSTLDLPASPALPLAGVDHANLAAAFWRAELERLNIPVLNLSELVADLGRARFYNAKMWYFGSLPFSQQGETLLAEEIVRVADAVQGKRKKCLVLDLDNTLWGGVIGEDGLEGISLAESGLGAQYRDAQRTAKELSAQGVLLAIASKNNIEDALLPLKKHPCMLLRQEDFVCVKANWEPKPANIAAIAKELNIGLDSLVFIDDNPVEREAVKAALPEVAVPEFPADTSQLPAFMARVARMYFTTLRVGDEDRQKTEMYKAESKREATRNAHCSLDDYLASLEMKLDLHRLREDEVPRAAQLTQKTNQFNLTARRYSESDIAAFLREKNMLLWMGALQDRFGNYGKICLVTAQIEQEGNEKIASIDTFLMSCRVMGRGVEDAVLSGIEQDLASNGITVVRGEYIETDKNSPARDFWNRMGYTPKEGLWILKKPLGERRTRICLNC